MTILQFINLQLVAKKTACTLLFIFISFSSFSQNLIVNGDFDVGSNNDPVPDWGGFDNRIQTDNITNDQIGQIENGDGTLNQDIVVASGETYSVALDYRWLDTGSPTFSSDLTIRVKDVNNIPFNLPLIAGTMADGFTLETTLDTWITAEFLFTVPSGITDVRFQMFKDNGNMPLNIDNVNIELICYPLNISMAQVASTSARFTWENTAATSASADSDWAVVVDGGNPDVPADVVDSDNVSVTVSTTSAIVATGLTANTDYDFYVRTNCSTGGSFWSRPLDFTPSFQGNLISNANFEADGGETGMPIDSWGGFKHQILVDNLTGDLVGNINNGDGSLYQIVDVVPGVEYSIFFDYRWVSGAGDYDMIFRIRDEDAGVLESSTLSTIPDQWFSENLVFTVPTGVTRLRIVFFKATGNNPFRLDNVSVVEKLDLSAEADYYYQSGIWTPYTPDGNSSNADDILIFDGRANIDFDLEANNFEVKPWALANISGSLSVAQDLITDGLTTFTSDSSGSGQLADASTTTITGNVRVERFIPAQTNTARAFRYMSSSVNSTESIRNNWQESGNTPDGIGTHITGSATGDYGFDQTETGNPSMFTFNNADTSMGQANAWEAIDNTNSDLLIAGKAYVALIRGDRNHDLLSVPTDNPNTNVTLRSNGTLIKGDQPTDLNPVANYFSLVGNPYQAQVDLNAIISDNSYTNLNTNHYWVWDPNISPNGGYVAVELPSGNSPGSSVINQYIQPGQSFFVQTLNDGLADITFTESSKSISQPQTEVFSEDEDPFINIRIYNDEALTNNLRESDALAIFFNENASNEVTQHDAVKFYNPSVNLARIENDQLLCIEKRALPLDGEILELSISGYVETNYTFEIDLSNFEDNFNVYLNDTYLDSQTLLSHGANYISFSVDEANMGSLSLDRFSLTFENTTLSIDDIVQPSGFSMYPNPVTNHYFEIKMQNTGSEDIQLGVYNLLGRAVYNQDYRTSSSGAVQVSLPKTLSSGTYLVEVIQKNERFATKLIVD